ncbi:hypothetical protein AAFC00_005720 [Neodothiora populina]|uniref:Midasin n=1 Tax=Neodothiora populina TaxID=2781224 RepID=A0ABR3P5L2_9PEZI
MDVTWEIQALRHAELPAELLDVLQTQDDDLVLNHITRAALDRRYTDTILTHAESLIPHCCASFSDSSDYISILAAYARLLPFAPLVAEFAQLFLQRQHESRELPADLDTRSEEYLLALFRILTFDRQTFAKYVPFNVVQAFLQHANGAARYLAVRVLSLCLNAADAAVEAMLECHVGERATEGQWEDKTIDYRFLTLWEEQRAKQLMEKMDAAERAKAGAMDTSVQLKRISADLLHPATACIAGILLPRLARTAEPAASTIVDSPTTLANLHRLAHTLKTPRPVLLTGLPGSGKTLLVRHAARQLDKMHSMVTLHLNEQSDAKLLIGMYTTGSTPGTFMWQPGVLTTAVMEGRWVFIEDLDRAPNDVISTLLPLIERRELVIPSRGQTIHAARGFRIIATMRTNLSASGHGTRPAYNLLGARHWQTVHVDMSPSDELKAIIVGLYPSLHEYSAQFVTVFQELQHLKRVSNLESKSRTGVMRAVNPRDLLKWCARVASMLGDKTTLSTSDLDQIFLDAVDCFAGALPEGDAYTALTSCIAQHLQIDPQRRSHLLSDRTIAYKAEAQSVRIGRNLFPRSQRKGITGLTNKRPFSTNAHTLRLMDRVGVAIAQREPLLLVGETGTGKTTSVQHLADQLGKKLVPFNLSQQSESGDLLGGFKPVSARSLILPMKEEFDDLFAATFSYKKNAQFLEMLNKCVAKSQWTRVCKLWITALGMVEQYRQTSQQNESQSPARQAEGQPNKKRRVESVLSSSVKERWEKFAQSVKSLEHRLNAGGQEAFAFAFVEGNIVKAVRNGDWVLLDEINLASPDTLEALADLFDTSSPSIMLSEAGSVDVIKAHPNFRVFAAMNPATDVGKKDLPLGIRSRFTELYVESPDRDFQSLLSIVQVYLGKDGDMDRTVAADVCHLHQAIQKLNEQNLLVDGAGQKPHFSLRTLTRALTYAKDVAPLCALRRALYEGIQMSFSTLLDKESEARILPLFYTYLFSKVKGVEAMLKKPFTKPSDSHAYVWEGPYWLRQGSLPVEEQPHYIVTPFVRRNLDNLIRASFTRRFPVLIQGPTSAGKTSMIEYLAKRSGNTFVRINNHEHTDLQEYLGTYVSGSDGRLTFQEGVLVKALREGHWIVLDELNLAPTDVLEALNRLLDDNRELLIPETQEVVRPHENFMLFATQNPAGLYGGRKVLSRAFRNRFLELHFDDIPVEELNIILEKRTGVPPSWCKKIVKVYRELSVLRQEERLFEQKSFATLRDLFRWALRGATTQEELAMHGFMLLAERVRKPEERQVVKKIIEKTLGPPRITIDESKLYGGQSKLIQPYLAQAQTSGVVWTSAMRRLYVLVATAIQNNEPVLLVGETGCGKTTVVQMLAEAVQKELGIVNAHQNTETGDLIGAQRPLRNRAGIEQQLRQMLAALPYPEVVETLNNGSIEEALEVLDKVKKATPQADVQVAGLLTQIELARPRLRALFEWADGSLVHAMKTGQYFLLDEISLADDSVLERLNSVLESSRSLLLAEKGSLDSFVTAQPGFQFFATMNPGGDYGKRELSPALRNRFTEIWVPALSDLDDIHLIIQSKLKSEAAKHAGVLVDFARWFNKRFNTSAASSISIRDTLAWVEFINRQQEHGLLFSVIHGAAMVYIDTLGANPAALLAINPGTVHYERTQCLDELSRLLQVDASSIYNAPIEIQLTSQYLTLGSFSLPVVSEATNDAGFTFQAPTTLSNATRVARALQLTKPVLLEGSPGVGKTTLVTALAAAIGMPLTRINLSEQTDLMDLFGSDIPVEGASAGTFAWRDAPFLRAMKAGEWVLLDEMNLASQSVLEGLNACLDHRGEVYISELDQTFQRHPEFRLFAAQNPHHQGGGRKGLPASFVNRFTVVYADVFQKEDLLMICRKSFPDLAVDTLQPTIEFIDRLDTLTQTRQIGALGSPWEFNLRDTLRWLGLVTSQDGLLQGGREAGDFLTTVITQRFRSPKDRALVRNLFEGYLGTSNGPNNMFHNISPAALQVGLGLLERNELISFQTQHECQIQARGVDYKPLLPILESVMIGIQRRWPILLVGPAGSGKTAVLEKLAGIVGADMVTFSMNADVDSMDLVGGYEQAEPKRAVNAFLERFTKFIESHIISQLGQNATSKSSTLVQQLLQLVDDAKKVMASADGLVQDALSQIVQLLGSNVHQFPTPAEALLAEAQKLASMPVQIDRAQFEWMDGTLVQALEQGKWLVLDNANLCSPAVLDRLNSLLEPGGKLIVNEHTDANGQAKIVEPAEGFRIFFTVDPKYGELSRALRNRAVELFMLQEESPQHDKAQLILGAESRMHRLRNAGLLAQTSPDVSEQEIRFQADIIADHLAHVDLSVLQSFASQLSLELYNVPAPVLQESFTRLMQIKNMQHLSQNGVADNLLSLQTVNPLNNVPLLLTVEGIQSSLLTTVATCQDIEIEILRMEAILAAVISISVPRREQTKLQRSANPGKSVNAGKELTAGVYPFLKNFVVNLREFIRQAFENENTTLTRPVAQTIKSYIRFWRNLLHLVDQQYVDEATFSSYLEIAQRLDLASQTSRSEIAEDGSLGLTIQSRFNEDIQSLQRASELQNANTMTALWRTLRPETPKTYEQVLQLAELGKMADVFDTAAWRFEAPIVQLLQLRDAFTRTIHLVVVGAEEASSLLSSLKEAMIGLAAPETQNELDIVVTKSFVSHFGLQLDGICQLFSIASPSDFSPSLQLQLEKASLLALQPTKNLKTGSVPVLQKLGYFIGFYGSSNKPLAIAEDLHTSILSGVKKAGEVPLSCLQLLKTEVEVLGQLVAGNSQHLDGDRITSLQSVLRQLVGDLAQALQVGCDSEILSDWASWALHATTDGRNAQSPTFAGRAKDTSIYEVRTRQLLSEPIKYLSNASGTLADAARAWLSFAMGALTLYIPTRAFDPALRPLLERDMFRSAHSTLSTQLRALYHFYQVSGQYSHVRVEAISKDIEELGEEPKIQEIARPQVSELANLQGEFTALLRALAPLTDNKKSGDLVENAKDEVLRQNVAMVKVRLSEGYKGYTDITGPVLGFLHALEIGFALAEAASTSAIDEKSVVVRKLTPLLSAKPELWQNENALIAVEQAKDSGVKIHALSSFATARGLLSNGRLSKSAWQTIDHVFDTFYQQWSVELQAGQQDTAQKKSLYRYRGDAELEDEIDEEEYRELFPEYDAENDKNGDHVKPSGRVQGLAPNLADAMHFIFKISGTKAEDLLSLMKKAANILSHTSKASRLDEAERSLTPLLMILLQEEAELLNGTSFTQRKYNIYTSPNLSEAEKTIALMKRIKARFSEIQAVWPEHATLGDVLRTSDEVLEFGHTEPVAKILTKVEKLHSYVHEWQVVASKEYTAAPLYDDLTNLLVSWRRLELSTWARMLDMEAEKCHEDAKNFFFLAYESIVVVPLQLGQTPAAMKLHVQELIKTLQGFFLSTGLGQFASRLAMIGDLARYVEQRSTVVPSLEIVHTALTNFIAYMKPYTPLVAEAVQKGRQGLEKNMKDIIQLASWKDTNIDALRQSAKSSHRRLFRVIRKFRDVLARPAEGIITAGLPDLPLAETATALGLRKIQAEIDDSAKSLCEENLPSWNERPARFRNLVATINVMHNKSSVADAAIDSASELHVFVSDTENLASQLRKATPTLLTEENKEMVKHLKSRKRKLFADVLKELRQMGFKSNLSSDVLARQDSLHAVLAAIPVLEGAEAEKHLYRLLHLMPKVRESSWEHSDDLTGAEVARSVALLESMLLVAIQQRNTLSSVSHDREILDNLIEQTVNLWSENAIEATTNTPAVNYTLVDAIMCLPSVIVAAAKIIKMHEQLSGIDCTDILFGFGRFESFWQTQKDKWISLPELPDGVTSSAHVKILEECKQTLNDPAFDLAPAMEKFPFLGATLKQVQLWSTVDTTDVGKKALTAGNEIQLAEFSQSVCEFVDTILGSVQDVEAPLSVLPQSTEDALWVVNEGRTLSTALKSLRLPHVTARLQTVLSQLQKLHSAQMKPATAVLHSYVPLLQQYQSITASLASRLNNLHTAISQTSVHLAKIFTTLAQSGFCTPSDKSAGQNDNQNEKLEGGTGLGEGEGGEDISKDIEDDEDLGELAQEKDDRTDKDDIEDEKDAVDMADQDMEGEMGDEPEKDDEEGEGSDNDDEEQDMEEEVGDVDDLGPSTVDEKMWDDGGKDAEKEQEGEEGQGQKDEENVGAGEDGEKKEKEEKGEDGDDEDEEMGAEEGEDHNAAPQDEIEKTDPHLQEEQNLDLPDDIDMDGQDEDEGDESGMEDMGDADMGEEEQKEFPETEGEIEEPAGAEEDAGSPDIPEDAPPELDAEKEETQDEEQMDKTQDAGEDADAEEEAPEDDEGLLQDDRRNDETNAAEDVAQSEAQGSGLDNMQPQDEQKQQNVGAAQQESGTEAAQPEQQQVAGAEGERGQAEQDQAAQGDEENEQQQDDGNKESEPFKKIGDALEKWYKQQRQIQDARAEKEERQEDQPDMDMADAEFEHLQDEADEADAQAMGAATEDQAKAIDEDAGIATNDQEKREDFMPEDDERDAAAEPYKPDNDVEMRDGDADEDVDEAQNPSASDAAQDIPSAFVGDPKSGDQDAERQDLTDEMDDEDRDVDEVDTALTSTHLSNDPTDTSSLMPLDAAREIYTAHETSTRTLSLLLAEHLRLILSPTTATKMRGDYRTGKRLNIKRIIPYIASSYKRDKIWMRRSVPSKRSYQIMLAIDDSKSMAEGGANELAFETMALVARALTILESGELSIVAFGDDVSTAHEFSSPFISEAGAEVIRKFSFEQTRTNVHRLIERSLEMFREARAAKQGGSATQELWQLQLIISDGVCEDHPSIRQLVRQAHAERIMIVFVIVDSASPASSVPTSGTTTPGGKPAATKSSSILDLQTATFSKNPETGELSVKTVKYLDSFPFGYYLVVRDVRELPGVLASALRGWFAEVVDSA